MKKRIAGVVCCLLGVPGCVELNDLTQSENFLEDIILYNGASDGQPIHILIPDEGFATSNRLSPGQAREVTVGLPSSGGTTTFRAGRNGQILASVQCASPQRVDTGLSPEVEWTGTRLVCLFWDEPVLGRLTRQSRR
jgi:hypothetical protein